MRRRAGRSVVILSGSLLLLAAFLGVALMEASFGTQATGAQAKELRRSSWDYSTVSVDRIFGNGVGKTTCVVSVCYLKSSGARCEKIEATVDGDLDHSAAAARTEALARVIGKLGDEGWEMVVGDGLGLGKDGEIKSLYFRRARR